MRRVMWVGLIVTLATLCGCEKPDLGGPLPPRVFTRAELETAVRGSALDDVRAMLGVPANSIGTNAVRYNLRTIDPVTGSPEEFVIIHFDVNQRAATFSYSGK